ncbi:MAG TPA: hypothetical protein VK607_21235, partial [Kofleriaceae bacterium]|nr:hypothetical protein [Kofleriaceae bacterium]
RPAAREQHRGDQQRRRIGGLAAEHHADDRPEVVETDPANQPVGHRHRRAHGLDDPIDLIETDDHARFSYLELESASGVRLERADVHGSLAEQ